MPRRKGAFGQSRASIGGDVGEGGVVFFAVDCLAAADLGPDFFVAAAFLVAVFLAATDSD